MPQRGLCITGNCLDQAKPGISPQLPDYQLAPLVLLPRVALHLVGSGNEDHFADWIGLKGSTLSGTVTAMSLGRPSTTWPVRWMAAKH